MTPVPVDLTSFTQLAVNMAEGLKTSLTTILPYGLAIAAGIMAVTLGVRVIRRLAK